MLTRQRIREQRANDIFQEAARILCDLGFERASIRDIAEATGMTKAGLYYYFKSKEELLFIILDSYMDELLGGISAIDGAEADPKTKLMKFIHFHVHRYSKDVHRSKLIIQDEHCLSGERRQEIKDKEKDYTGYWKRAFSAYCEQEGKEIADVSAHVMILLGICNWTYKWYDPTGSLTPDDLAELIFQLFFQGFRG